MSPYAASHANPKGAGDARPTALQTIHEKNFNGQLTEEVIVITGTTSRIGIETARALSVTGATFILTPRHLKNAEAALTGILEPGRVPLMQMDNASVASVRAAAPTILANAGGSVNILVGNAGIMGIED